MLSQRSRTILIYFQDSVEWKSPVDFSMRLGESHRKINDPWIHFKTKSKLRRDSSFFQFGWRELGKSYHNGLIISMKLRLTLTTVSWNTTFFHFNLSENSMFRKQLLKLDWYKTNANSKKHWYHCKSLMTFFCYILPLFSHACTY